MRKVIYSLILTMLLLALIPAAYAFESTLTAQWGGSIPTNDMQGDKIINGYGALSYDAWLKKDLALGIEPFFTKLKVRDNSVSPIINRYESSLEGVNLYLKYRPTKGLALNFKNKDIINRISPFVTLGAGPAHEGSSGRLNNVYQRINKSIWVLPHASIGISTLTKWNTVFDVGVKYDYTNSDDVDLDNTSSWNDGFITPYVGIGITFGKHKEKAAVPALIIAGTLDSFSTKMGTPSAAQSYTLTGTNLKNNISITVPNGYELTVSGASNYGNSASLPPNFNGTVWVRLTGAQEGTYSGNVINFSSGATNVNIPVIGIVTKVILPAMINVTGSMDSFSTEMGTPSAAQSYTLSGGNLTNNIGVSVPNGYEYSVDGGSTWVKSASLPSNFNGKIWVRLTGAKDGYFSGNVVNSSNGATSISLPVNGTVTKVVVPVPAPVIMVSGDLDDFSTEMGTPSAAQSYTLSGGNLTNNIGITVPNGYELSVDGGSTWVRSASLPPNFNGKIWVRMPGAKDGYFSGNVVNSSSGATSISLPVNGTVTKVVVPASVPVIMVSGDLDDFSTEMGTPSAAQSYTLSGGNLTNNLGITVPNGYELSVDGGSTWVKSISLPPSFNGKVWVRMTGAQDGTFSGNVINSSSGATNVSIPVNGRVTKAVVPVPVVFVSGSLEGFSTEMGTPSAAQSYTLSGGNLTNNIGITVPNGYELSVDGGSSWVKSASLPPNFNDMVWVRLTGAQDGTFSGNVVNTSSGAANVSLPVIGIVTKVIPPAIIHVSGNMDSFSTLKGTPSAAQSYTLTGGDLTNNIGVTVPNGYELSIDGGTSWVNSTSLPPNFNGMVWVRLTGDQDGTFNGDVVNSSGGATTVSLPVNGVVTKPVEETALEEDLYLHVVHFPTNIFVVIPEDKIFLDRVAESLKKLPKIRLQVQGHCDTTGNDAINIPLSLNRAKFVRDYLVDKGIDTNRLEVKGFSSDKPIATNDTKEGRTLNRRVDFIIIN